MQLHWDGNNTSVDERNLSAAFGTGAYPPTLDVDRVLRTAKWLETAKPLAYPYQIDGSLAAQGQHIYEEYCTRCHGTREPPFRHDPPPPNELVGTVVPIEKIGTDRWRLDSYTWVLAVNQSTLYAGYEKDWGFDPPYPQRFSHFRKQPGYANRRRSCDDVASSPIGLDRFALPISPHNKNHTLKAHLGPLPPSCSRPTG